MNLIPRNLLEVSAFDRDTEAEIHPKWCFLQFLDSLERNKYMQMRRY